jgi:hypothetical protein
MKQQLIKGAWYRIPSWEGEWLPNLQALNKLFGAKRVRTVVLEALRRQRHTRLWTHVVQRPGVTRDLAAPSCPSFGSEVVDFGQCFADTTVRTIRGQGWRRMDVAGVAGFWATGTHTESGGPFTPLVLGRWPWLVNPHRSVRIYAPDPEDLLNSQIFLHFQGFSPQACVRVTLRELLERDTEAVRQHLLEDARNHPDKGFIPLLHAAVLYDLFQDMRSKPLTCRPPRKLSKKKGHKDA